MGRKAFDKFFVDGELGGNPKIGRLTDAQFRCLVTGVWTLAAKASPRGYLVVAGDPFTAQDVAHQAHCSIAVARSTIDKLRRMEMIELDDETGLEFCHDWWTLNPDPKQDSTNAERQARYRDRHNASSNGGSNAVTNGQVTPPEVEERANALSSGAERAARENEKASDEDRANCRRFSELILQRNPKAKIPKGGTGEYAAWLSSMRLLRTADGNTADEIRRGMEWAVADEFWGATIQAPSGLREHFPQIWAKMLAAATPKNGAAQVESIEAYAARKGIA